jgi:hypothetical protein
MKPSSKKRSKITKAASGKDKRTKRGSEPVASERQFESVRKVRERVEEQPSRTQPERIAPTPANKPETLESVVSETKQEPSEPKEHEALERRVARSTDPKDLATMRRLAEKVYRDGWNRLNTDEQLAFLYHSRFLDYLSSKERERADVQSTMYRVLGAQAKSLGLETRYTTRELSMITDRFFTQVKTPQNAPELYRKPANTDYFKADQGR